MDLFYKDSIANISISWEGLINDIHKQTLYNPYLYTTSYYDIFRQIITSMLIGREIILLDADFSQNELLSLTGFTEYQQFDQHLQNELTLLPNCKSELLNKLKNTDDNWKITLFTSGTTGLPKKVTHNFTSIARFVKYADHNIQKKWGFAYNPTHMAGIQVFLQALLNGNTIVRLFGLPNEAIQEEIKNNALTHISATPTFYRLLLPCKETFLSIERITSGGEKFSEKTIKNLSEVFPNAKITNVYASTEAGTLFASENDIFTLQSAFKQFIKVEENELLIHKSILGNSELNIDEWYNTGDLIEIISSDPLKFRFLSRKNDMINVGGYKVNSIEVEECLLKVPGVREARVFSKSNSVLGNIICCEIVGDKDLPEESMIREYLRGQMQDFKIPRIIHFVKEITTTRTGKIKRF